MYKANMFTISFSSNKTFLTLAGEQYACLPYI